MVVRIMTDEQSRYSGMHRFFSIHIWKCAHLLKSKERSVEEHGVEPSRRLHLRPKCGFGCKALIRDPFRLLLYFSILKVVGMTISLFCISLLSKR